MNENVKFNIIKKNGKPFVRMTSYGTITDMKIWKISSDNPYVKYLGMTFYLDENMKKELI